MPKLHILPIKIPCLAGFYILYATISVKGTPLCCFYKDQDSVEPTMKLSYTECPGIKHSSWIEAYSEPGLFEWLFAQK